MNIYLKIINVFPELFCGKNETLNLQALPCVVHCTFRYFTSCPYPPKPACECKEGFIRSTSTGPCIATSDCRFINQ